MFNKWFWLELRWAVIVNGFGGLILSSFIAITLVPIITYHLWVNTHELHNSRVPGIPVVNETSLLAKALIMVMVNALLLCGYYKSKRLLYIPWLIINAFVIVLLSKAVVQTIYYIIRDSRIIHVTDAALAIFTAYLVYSYIAICAHYLKNRGEQHGEIRFAADASI